MENLCVSKRYRLMFNPERTTKQKINITPRRIVKFITVLCWRQFEAISGKALVVLRINEWLCFLRVPSGISRIYTNQSFVDACRELEREREKIVFVENEIQRVDVETTKCSNITSNIIYWIKANDGELRG